jgi:hypothetical protein
MEAFSNPLITGKNFRYAETCGYIELPLAALDRRCGHCTT